MHDKWKAPEAGAGGAGHRPAVIEDASLGDASSALLGRAVRQKPAANQRSRWRHLRRTFVRGGETLVLYRRPPGRRS
jgi:hypothetical protein